MKLLGSKNWYLPDFLQWLPDLNVDGSNASSDTATATRPLAPEPAAAND